MENTVLSQFQPLGFLAITPKGGQILAILRKNLGGTLWITPNCNFINLQQQEDRIAGNIRIYDSSLKQHLAAIWYEYRALVFCVTTGAVVRLIAPFLKNKATDPAIIVIDPEGHFVISLCGGHQGSADLLTKIIAEEIEAIPIITGASNSLNLPGIDILGNPYGWAKGEGNWTEVMGIIAREGLVEVFQDAGSSLWRSSLPESHTLVVATKNKDTGYQGRISISASKENFVTKSSLPQVQWHPRVLWVGIGCERDTPKEVIENAIADVCQRNNLADEAIAGIATIDIKADEAGILELCQERNFPLKTFSSEMLKSVAVPTPSAIVKQEVGTPSVAEAAAILAAKKDSNPDLLVKKQIYKSDQPPGGVTVAIAKSEVEYIGKVGKIYLVGIGPGNLDQITPAAKTAITQADVVIGYSLYTDLVAPLFRVGQVIESLPITQEKARGQRAIELAQWGLTVAVISSGDCGIYGMAGLVLEQLRENNWDGKTPQVQVLPGISALQAVASRVGAPLMHDFCAISLSDLLTPWEVILKRLEAAAMGDFVTAIYNPRSQKRTHQIIKAQEIFLQYRAKDTPVAIVKSVYRDDEKIIVTTLEKMLNHEIDMLTTVMIGNSNTYNHGDWIITPRGYLDNKKKPS